MLDLCRLIDACLSGMIPLARDTTTDVPGWTNGRVVYEWLAEAFEQHVLPAFEVRLIDSFISAALVGAGDLARTLRAGQEGARASSRHAMDARHAGGRPINVRAARPVRQGFARLHKVSQTRFLCSSSTRRRRQQSTSNSPMSTIMMQVSSID